MSKLRIVMLVGPGRSSRIMYHALAREVDIACVIREHGQSPAEMFARRLRRLGRLKVIGQAAFIASFRVMARFAEPQIRRLLAAYRLDDSPLPASVVREVVNINDLEVAQLLRETRPAAVVVNGTRIIAPAILDSVKAPFLNTHLGITPKYRGVHGGYWALARGDRANCGVTVHLVDAGIDTGGVLYQDRIEPDGSDRFHTYPVHQLAKAIPLMKQALADVAAGRLRPQPGVGPSELFYHPTLLEYLRHRLIRGVR